MTPILIGWTLTTAVPSHDEDNRCMLLEQLSESAQERLQAAIRRAKQMSYNNIKVTKDDIEQYFAIHIVNFEKRVMPKIGTMLTMPDAYVDSSIEMGERNPAFLPCLPDEDSINRDAVVKLQFSRDLADRVYTESISINDQSFDLNKLIQARHDYNRNTQTYKYVTCEPSFAAVDQAYTSWANSFNAAVTDMRRSIPKVFANSEREYAKLIRILSEVRQARSEFDSTGDGGTQSIIDAHRNFEVQAKVCDQFWMPEINIDGKNYDPKPFFDNLQKAIVEEVAYSEITELDRLRNEYFAKAIPVPSPSKFTRSKSSRLYTFAQLNTGSYEWAILEDVMLNSLDSIHDAMIAAGHRVQINSVYRNPNRSSGRSQHQYGFAIDIQTFDFNRDRVVNEEDWEILRTVTSRFNPSYTEPISQSSVGHVHVDWRGQQVVGEGTLSFSGEYTIC